MQVPCEFPIKIFDANRNLLAWLLQRLQLLPQNIEISNVPVETLEILFQLPKRLQNFFGQQFRIKNKLRMIRKSKKK